MAGAHDQYFVLRQGPTPSHEPFRRPCRLRRQLRLPHAACPTGGTAFADWMAGRPLHPWSRQLRNYSPGRSGKVQEVMNLQCWPASVPGHESRQGVKGTPWVVGGSQRLAEQSCPGMPTLTAALLVPARLQVGYSPSLALQGGTPAYLLPMLVFNHLMQASGGVWMFCFEFEVSIAASQPGATACPELSPSSSRCPQHVIPSIQSHVCSCSCGVRHPHLSMSRRFMPMCCACMRGSWQAWAPAGILTSMPPRCCHLRCVCGADHDCSAERDQS